MVPRLKSYSEPPFMRRQARPLTAWLVAVFVASFLLGLWVPEVRRWNSLILGLTFIPVCLVGVRHQRRWKRLLKESDGYLCPFCGYNLRGTPEVQICPECGQQPADWRGW